MLRKVFLHVIVALCLSVFFTCCWTMLLNRSSGRIVHSWQQPENIDYWKNARYSLYVREKAPDWYLVGGRKHRHEIFIGWSEDYGHWFDCTFHAESLNGDAIDEYIRRSTVEWTEVGISLKQESGHVVFFPKKTFIGGR